MRDGRAFRGNSSVEPALRHRHPGLCPGCCQSCSSECEGAWPLSRQVKLANYRYRTMRMRLTAVCRLSRSLLLRLSVGSFPASPGRNAARRCVLNARLSCQGLKREGPGPALIEVRSTSRRDYSCRRNLSPRHATLRRMPVAASRAVQHDVSTLCPSWSTSGYGRQAATPDTQ